MAGRAGRGVAIAKYLAEKKAAEEQQQQQQQQQPGSASNELPIQIGGRGRAMAMMQLRMQQEQQAQQQAQQLQQPAVGAASAAPSVPATSPPLLKLPVGRGMVLLASQQASAAAKSTEPANTVAKATEPPANKRHASLGKALSAMKLEENLVEPVRCSGVGGRKIRATANYIRLEMEKGMGVFEYEVKFDPDVDSLQMRFKHFNEHKAALGASRIFDGSFLFLPYLLPDKVTTYQVSNDIEMLIVYKSRGEMYASIHLYNVLFKKIMTILQMVRFGRQHFNPHNVVDIKQHKLEVWPGYVTAVDEFEDGLMLCLDSSHRVLRTNTVYDMIREVSLRDVNYKSTMSKELINQSVLTRYNNKLYRVDDVDWNKSPLTTFDTRRDGTITFVKYYEQHYGIKIKDVSQPMLISQVKTKNSDNEVENQFVCLVPELCYVTGLSDTMRSDFKVMKDISAHTRITPNQRKLAMKKFITNVNNSPEAVELLKGWGLSLALDSVELVGRVVDAEPITFANMTVPGSAQADWGSAACRNKPLETMGLHNWCLVHSPRDRNACEELIKCLKKVCPQMGMDMSSPILVPLRDDKIDTYIRGLREQAQQGRALAVVICPTARDDRYSAIKKTCCVEYPMASQVINARTLSRPDKNRSIVQKIALQINCKLGGALWSIKMPFSDVMVVGIDTYHDASRKGNSVGGFVASINPALTKWFSRLAMQSSEQELIDGLKGNLVAALKRYNLLNHKFPDRVVIYRDGVGDGQLKMTQEFEVKQFKSCFQLVYSTYNPKLSFIVCQKRINSRIFRCPDSGLDNLENPPPGTIIDNVITRRNWYDFFLVSQCVRQGTVSPTHYIVLFDECGLKPDHMQRLTYKLCHLYYNWPGTIRVPAPVQYAHKLAQLVGQNIHREPSDTLTETLFYL